MAQVKYKVIDTFDPNRDYGIEITRQVSQCLQILEKINHMVVTENKSFKQIRDDLVLMESEDTIPNLGYTNRDSKYFNNMYLKWKKSNSKQ